MFMLRGTMPCQDAARNSNSFSSNDFFLASYAMHAPKQCIRSTCTRQMIVRRICNPLPQTEAGGEGGREGTTINQYCVGDAVDSISKSGYSSFFFTIPRLPASK